MPNGQMGNHSADNFEEYYVGSLELYYNERQSSWVNIKVI